MLLEQKENEAGTEQSPLTPCICYLKTALAGSQFQVVGKELKLTTVRKLTTVTGPF